MPHPKPVERIELNQEHVGPRLLAACVLLVIGAGLLAYSFMRWLSPVGEEWITVEASSSEGAGCGSEFNFIYHPGSGELSYSADRKAVTTVYSQLCRDAFELFHEKEAFEGVNNVYAINRHPNEILEVEDGLYKALALVEQSGSRAIYLGPVYSRYDDLFFCEDDSQLVDFDPRLNADVAEEYREITRFAGDPDAIRVELLGEGKIRLYVSEEYLTYARQEEIETFIDFAWMRNAFIADFMAEALIEKGYTYGVLSSYDGFTRNLDARGTDYTYPLYHRQGETILSPAELHYSGPMSLVRMRDYPLSGLDLQQYYTLQTGEIRTLYLDTADALCKSAIDTLVCYSREKGCAQLLLEMIPVYIADGFQEEAVAALAGDGIQSIYCRDGVVRYTDPAAVLENFFDWDGVRYSAGQIALS